MILNRKERRGFDTENMDRFNLSALSAISAVKML